MSGQFFRRRRCNEQNISIQKTVDAAPGVPFIWFVRAVVRWVLQNYSLENGVLADAKT